MRVPMRLCKQWEHAGLGDYFARATDSILPPDLAERVLREVLLFEKHEKEERAKSVAGGTVSADEYCAFDAYL